jgi:hypothetical protein
MPTKNGMLDRVVWDLIQLSKSMPHAMNPPHTYRASVVVPSHQALAHISIDAKSVIVVIRRVEEEHVF